MSADPRVIKNAIGCLESIKDVVRAYISNPYGGMNSFSLHSVNVSNDGIEIEINADGDAPRFDGDQLVDSPYRLFFMGVHIQVYRAAEEFKAGGFGGTR